MGKYMVFDTGVIYTESELIELYSDACNDGCFMSKYPKFEDYLEDMLVKGTNREGGLIREDDIWACVEIRDIDGDMPFDRWDTDHYVHATGREYWDPYTECWRVEYEDDPTVNF